MHGADVGAEARGVGVFGDGDGDLDVIGCAAAFKLGFCLGTDVNMGDLRERVA